MWAYETALIFGAISLNLIAKVIDTSIQVLEKFLERKRDDAGAAVDRDEVVAHATLSAWVHHWPARAGSEIEELLRLTAVVKETERSRWMTQRRIAIAKLVRELEQVTP